MGRAPFVPLNETRVVMVLEPLASSKTVPRSSLPPFVVVPYRFPAASASRQALGLEPLQPSNDANVVIVLEPAPSSKMVPSLPLPPP